MQAIITKHLPFTNTKPARIKATCSRGSITICEDSVKESAHIEAANKLIDKFVNEDVKRGISSKTNPLNKEFVTDQLPNMDYVHVFLPHGSEIIWPKSK